FWEARSHAVSVVLDPEMWPLYLQNVPYQSRWEVLVAQEALGARKCYWEVELGQQRRWVVGVLGSRWSIPSLHTQHSWDFWALAGFNRELFSCDCVSRHKLGEQRKGFSVVGVFLDLEKAQLEFYDVERRDLMVARSLRAGENPAGKFFPFVSRGEEGPLRICPVPIPVPI
ncbi:butyrophilin-like protein 8, partial [Malurus melanocephalus]|uniref:butyrophilin-like protein 8 n=1 Tax=Malurus melanocephalus TaxID=175006 RepID=UPI002546AF24